MGLNKKIESLSERNMGDDMEERRESRPRLETELRAVNIH